jgi:ubiquinone/menaquinone biosynthesis C-methylase UbiE
LNSLGYQIAGADISPFMVRQAKTLWSEGGLLDAASSSLPFEAGSFDLAVFVTCFEYMPDPVGVLREAARVARKGIVLGLMNSWSLPTVRRKLQMALGKNDYYLTAHFYSLTQMKSLVRKAFGNSARLTEWKTTLFPAPLGLERDTGIPFGAFLGVAIKKIPL